MCQEAIKPYIGRDSPVIHGVYEFRSLGYDTRGLYSKDCTILVGLHSVGVELKLLI